MKTCTRCGKSKDSIHFYKDSRRRDGLRPWCKVCCNEDSRQREHLYSETRDKYREESKTKAAKHKRAVYKENKDEILESNRKWRQSLRGRLLSYRRGAIKRGINFNLSEEEFQKFWKKPCYYCSSDVDTIGLDRLDSQSDYTIENVVSCCTVCNKMKMVLSIEEFVSHIKKIHDNLFGGNFYEV